MSHIHVLSRLYNNPLAISRDKLEVLTANVTIPLLLGENVNRLDQQVSQQDSFDTNNAKIGIITVFGSLVAKNGVGDSGVTSYTSISNSINSALENGATRLIFYIDSPGGEVSGLFGLANYISSLPSLYGIQTVAITDGQAASAAYAIAASCQQFHATSTSIVGSIGVLMTLISTAQADKSAGIEYKILRSKEGKALFSAHEPISDNAISTALGMLDTLDKEFNTFVSSVRPKVSASIIENLNGGVVLGQEALQNNLIDGLVPSVQDFIRTFSLSTKPTIGGFMPITLEEMQVQLAQANEAVAQAKEATSVAVASAIASERNRVQGILEAANTFGISKETTLKRIMGGSSVEDTVSMFEEIKQHLQMNNPTPAAKEVSSFAGAIPNVLQPSQAATNPFDAILAGNAALKSQA